MNSKRRVKRRGEDKRGGEGREGKRRGGDGVGWGEGRGTCNLHVPQGDALVENNLEILRFHIVPEWVSATFFSSRSPPPQLDVLLHGLLEPPGEEDKPLRG